MKKFALADSLGPQRYNYAVGDAEKILRTMEENGVRFIDRDGKRLYVLEVVEVRPSTVIEEI